MQPVSQKDREVLRGIARRKLELANSPENEIIRKKWQALASLRRETPTVRLLFSNFTNEVITPRMQCEGREARALEFSLLWSLVGRELFDDDTPLSPVYEMSWNTWADPFGIKPHLIPASGPNPKGYHIEPIIEDLSTQLDQLRGGSFGTGTGYLWRYPAGAHDTAQPAGTYHQSAGHADGYGELSAGYVRYSR